MKEEGCTLWEQTRTLAQARKLEMSGTCPIDAYCKGTQCIYLSRKLSDAERLTDLRQELAVLKLKNDLQKN